MGCHIEELYRLAPRDGVKNSRNLQAAFGETPPATLLVYNPLSAPIFFRLIAAEPSALVHDVACPGSAIMAWPIDPSTGVISALVKYPGAVPVGDVADAVIRVTSAQLPAFVGAIN